MRVLSLVLILLWLTGCSVFMAADGGEEYNYSLLKEGTPREAILASFGDPKSSEAREDGRIVDTYVLDDNFGSRSGAMSRVNRWTDEYHQHRDVMDKVLRDTFPVFGRGGGTQMRQPNYFQNMDQMQNMSPTAQNVKWVPGRGGREVWENDLSEQHFIIPDKYREGQWQGPIPDYLSMLRKNYPKIASGEATQHIYRKVNNVPIPTDEMDPRFEELKRAKAGLEMEIAEYEANNATPLPETMARLKAINDLLYQWGAINEKGIKADQE